MDRFLTDNDYLRAIQLKELLVTIEDNYEYLYAVEQSAYDEIKSYLVQRYQMDKALAPTTTFDLSATYYGKNLVEYTADHFILSGNYSTDNRVVYNGYIYKALSATTNVFPDTGTTWQQIAKDKSLYYAKTPVAEYGYKTTYALGSQVWYNNGVYLALQESTGVYPDMNTAIWQLLTTYSFSGEYPDNTAYWIKGDNRNQQLVMAVIDVTLYHIHARINPRNVPELRCIRYDGNSPTQKGGVIGWLKNVGAGLVTAELPSIVPDEYPSRSIIWGSSASKVRNFY